MDDAIRALLDVLEAAEADGVSLNDTVLREALQDVIHFGFVERKADYRVPSDLLLYYTEPAAKWNEAVVAALQTFLDRTAAIAPKSAEEREAAFFQSEVQSSSGETNVDSFFE